MVDDTADRVCALVRSTPRAETNPASRLSCREISSRVFAEEARILGRPIVYEAARSSLWPEEKGKKAGRKSVGCCEERRKRKSTHDSILASLPSPFSTLVTLPSQVNTASVDLDIVCLYVVQTSYCVATSKFRFSWDRGLPARASPVVCPPCINTFLSASANQSHRERIRFPPTSSLHHARTSIYRRRGWPIGPSSATSD